MFCTLHGTYSFINMEKNPKTAPKKVTTTIPLELHEYVLQNHLSFSHLLTSAIERERLVNENFSREKMKFLEERIKDFQKFIEHKKLNEEFYDFKA